MALIPQETKTFRFNSNCNIFLPFQTFCSAQKIHFVRHFWGSLNLFSFCPFSLRSVLKQKQNDGSNGNRIYQSVWSPPTLKSLFFFQGICYSMKKKSPTGWIKRAIIHGEEAAAEGRQSASSSGWHRAVRPRCGLCSSCIVPWMRTGEEMLPV